MKKLFVLIFAITMPIVASAEMFAIGGMLGTPNGVTAKLWLDQQRAVDAAAEWRTSGDDEFYLHANYLIHTPLVLKDKSFSGKPSYYYGIGGFYQERDRRLRSDEEIFAVRLPLGLSYLHGGMPIEGFVELVPVLEVSPDSDFGVDLGVGIRYLFR